jgi:hypothetical protein
MIAACSVQFLADESRFVAFTADCSCVPMRADSWSSGVEEGGMQGVEEMGRGEFARDSVDGIARDSELAVIAELQRITDSYISGILVKERVLFPPGLVLAYPLIVHRG